jgi:hypothetical protein
MSRTALLPVQSSVYVPIGHISTWWEGESLYGWCSRLQASYGGKAQTLGIMLFGRPYASRNVDVPSGLDRFVAATAGKLGGVEEILRTRTVVAAYWPFADQTTRAKVLDAVTDTIGTPAPHLLGLTAAQIGARHPLRSCAHCREAALARDGYATWKLHHQLPGVWWCTEHKRPLEQLRTERAIWRQSGVDEIALAHRQMRASNTRWSWRSLCHARCWTSTRQIRPAWRACVYAACVIFRLRGRRVG